MYCTTVNREQARPCFDDESISPPQSLMPMLFTRSVQQERSGGTVQELLWCLNLSSDGARAAKYTTDLQLAPSHERARAWGGLEDDQRKTLGIRAKGVLLRDGTRYIEV